MYIRMYMAQGRTQDFISKGGLYNIKRHRRAKCERGGGGGGGVRAGDPCVSPHTSGVKVPHSARVPFTLSFATGYTYIYLAHM